jgi:hypothetical protein
VSEAESLTKASLISGAAGYLYSLLLIENLTKPINELSDIRAKLQEKIIKIVRNIQTNFMRSVTLTTFI